MSTTTSQLTTVNGSPSGAFGTFTVTKDVTGYTKAGLFSAVGKQTGVCLRFSTVAGGHGGADAERDVRGFAVKFYTDEGNWDLVGNNTPVFFVRDPFKFQMFIHTQKRHPKTNLRNMDMQWDFWSLCPESLHQVTILFSDRGHPGVLPRSTRVRQPHLLAHQRARRARLVQVPFPMHAGHPQSDATTTPRLIARIARRHQRTSSTTSLAASSPGGGSRFR